MRRIEQQGTIPSRAKKAEKLTGCFWKNSQIRPLAEMLFADLPKNQTIEFRPGQVCPPPLIRNETASAPSLPGP